jgi:RNA polymerase primary sigma factor
MAKKFEFSETLDFYFKELEKVSSPLTKSQEHQLATRIQSGDTSAINELVLHNLKFVVLLANKFIGMGLNIDDLIQEGNRGLIEAAKRFTPDKNTKFITYAQFWIRKYLNESIVNFGRTVKLPHNQEYDIYKEKVSGTYEGNLVNVSLDKPINEEEDFTMGDLLLNENFSDPFEKEDETSQLNFFLKQLNSEEIKIIKLYYGIEETSSLSTREVARIVGIEETRVNRILKIARSKMRKAITKKS